MLPAACAAGAVSAHSGALVQVEGIGIEHRREACAVRGQRLGRDRGGHHLLALADLHLRLAKEINHGTVASVMQLVAVHADAVDRRHEAQVLDGPRTQQRLPRVGTRRRPVGDEDLQVEVQLPGALDVVAVAAEHREAQVVADLRIDPPALPLHAQALAAGGIALVAPSGVASSRRL
ncbi:hypothetical protein G6F23_013388 [Rhizopus arrhizus]|nr:hypothetical protein G6F23_013388 [Rhizopus arrhizus]